MSARPDDQACLLGHLLTPLGLRSAAVVAGGRFSPLRVRMGQPDFKIRPQDLMILESPTLQSSSTAVMLVTLLSRRAQLRVAQMSQDVAGLRCRDPAALKAR